MCRGPSARFVRWLFAQKVEHTWAAYLERSPCFPNYTSPEVRPAGARTAVLLLFYEPAIMPCIFFRLHSRVRLLS